MEPSCEPRQIGPLIFQGPTTLEVGDQESLSVGPSFGQFRGLKGSPLPIWGYSYHRQWGLSIVLPDISPTTCEEWAGGGREDSRGKSAKHPPDVLPPVPCHLASTR